MKINSKWIKDNDVRPGTFWLLGESKIQALPRDSNSSRNKTNSWWRRLCKIKKILCSKGNNKQSEETEYKIEGNHCCYTPNTGVISTIYKTLQKSTQTLQNQIIWSINGQMNPTESLLHPQQSTKCKSKPQRDSIPPQSGCCHEVDIDCWWRYKTNVLWFEWAVPHRLRTIAGSTVWKGLGGVTFLKEACYCRQGFEIKDCTHFWFPLSASCLWLGFEHSASSHLPHASPPCWALTLWNHKSKQNFSSISLVCGGD